MGIKDISKGLSAARIGITMTEEKNRKIREKERQASTDTDVRIEIHSEIKRLLEYGLSQKETLERLTEKFSDSKYICYFENWISDHFKKINKQVKELKEDERSI